MIVLSVLTVFLSTFLLAAVAVLVASLVLQRRQAEGTELADEGPSLFKEDSLSSISVWDNLLAQFHFVEGLKARVEQAGLDWSVGRLTAMMLLIGAVALSMLTGVDWLPLWAAVGLSGAAASTPYLYVRRLRGRRLDLIEEQLPEALDFMARALRAGHPFGVTMELLASENAPPLSGEIRIAADERRFGRSWEEALHHLCRRVPLQSMRLFVAAVLVQNRTGGKLSEVLERLSETLREGTSLKGEVRAIAAHGRTTGFVLTVLPLGIAVLMMVVNPSYLAILLTTELGRDLIAAAVVALVAAHFVIQRIVDIRI